MNILISGGTGSGKSTLFSGKNGTGILGLAHLFTKKGFPVIQISTDDYYKSMGNLPISELKKINYDNPNTINSKLFKEQLMTLKQSKPIDLPQYNFKTFAPKNETKKIVPFENSIIGIDGMFSLCYKDSNELYNLKVFYDVPEKERLRRRLARDVVERGRTEKQILEMWERSVKPMHDKYIEPCKYIADIIITDENREQSLNEIVNIAIKEMN